MNNNELLQNAIAVQKNKIISKSEYWISFIQTMSRHYKHSSAAQIPNPPIPPPAQMLTFGKINLTELSPAEKAFRFLQMITQPHAYTIYPRPVLFPAKLQKCPGYGTCLTPPLK